MSATAPPVCPYCAAPFRNQTVSTKGFTKAHYSCGTVVGYFHQQVVPVRSELCRKKAEGAQQAPSK